MERLVRIVYGERSRISAEELRKMLGIKPRDRVDVPSINVCEREGQGEDKMAIPDTSVAIERVRSAEKIQKR